MSDWRQIQARIRKARTSADPPGQLVALYERTHDAMVAFELAQVYEKAGALPEAVQWYTSAAERFRRAQWKQKAEEALTRLGAPIPLPLTVTPAVVSISESTAQPADRLEPIIAEFSEEQVIETGEELDGGQQESVFEQPAAGTVTATPVVDSSQGHRRKRRGRRGGRGRNKGARTGTPSSVIPLPVQAPPSVFDRASEPRTFQAVRPHVNELHVSEPRVSDVRAPDSRASELRSSEDTMHLSAQEPQRTRSFEAAGNPSLGSSLQLRARSGDPALSSRMVQLESQLRRMLACAVHSVDQPEDAPAGPGVFLITDTDQTTYYYVEACQTLRVGIGNLLRSGRGSREGANLKEKLADHLGINEARVGKYLKDHCIVRWLQLDEGAPLLSHFAVAVLRPVANE